METHAQHKATKYYGKCSHNILSNKGKISCNLCAIVKNILLVCSETLKTLFILREINEILTNMKQLFLVSHVHFQAGKIGSLYYLYYYFHYI